MLGPICVFHCVTILGPLSRACLMELLVGGFWFHSAFSAPSPCSVLRLVCPPPCTIVCACLRQSQAQNSFKFNSNVTFCVIFSLAFLFSFCVGIFGAFDKCSDGADRQERGGLKNTVTERLNRFGFEGGFELEFVLPLQSSFVCSLFLLRLFVMLLFLLLLLLFVCALLSSIVIQKWLHYLYSHFFVFLSLFLSLAGFLFVLTRNVIHASVFVVVVLIVICIDGVYFILCCWACV